MLEGRTAKFRVAMRPVKRRVLPETPDGRLLKLAVVAQDHMLAKVEHPFRVVKQLFGFSKTRPRGLTKKRCKVNVLAALTNLFMAHLQLPVRS